MNYVKRQSFECVRFWDRISLTNGPWFQILYMVVNFVDEFVPVCDISAAFLEIMRFDNFFQENGVEMERVVGSPQRQTLRWVVLCKSDESKGFQIVRTKFETTKCHALIRIGAAQFPHRSIR